MITRNNAMTLLDERGTTPSLRQHALASEAVMRALARYFGEDEDVWGLTGLLHDLDYPTTVQNPERHGLDTAEILVDQLPEEALAAIRAHNAEFNGSIPSTRFDFALRCGETVTGLIIAAARMRPTGLQGMEARSIKKKMKDKAFAASVNRENIRQCSQAGMELDEFLTLAIEAMRTADIGLNI